MCDQPDKSFLLCFRDMLGLDFRLRSSPRLSAILYRSCYFKWRHIRTTHTLTYTLTYIQMHIETHLYTRITKQAHLLGLAGQINWSVVGCVNVSVVGVNGSACACVSNACEVCQFVQRVRVHVCVLCVWMCDCACVCVSNLFSLTNFDQIRRDCVVNSVSGRFLYLFTISQNYMYDVSEESVCLCGWESKRGRERESEKEIGERK